MDTIPPAASVGDALLKPTNAVPMLAPMLRPVPGYGNALLRVICVGLCRTDLLVAAGAVVAGKDKLVLGHEFCGIVEEANGPCAVSPGAVVAVDPTFERPDGSDGFMGREVDGCLATWAVVPVDRLFPVSAGLSAPEAAYLEPVAAAMGGVDAALAAARPGGNGALIGDNRIATLTAALLRDAGLAFDHLSHDGLREAVREVRGGSGRYDWLIESGLTDDLFDLAAEALRPKGAVILKSRHRATASFPAMRWAEKQLSIVGRSRAGFPEAMRWLAANAEAVRPLLGDAYRLSDWEAAFAAAGAGEGGKVFLVPDTAEEEFRSLGGRVKAQG